MLTSKLVGKGYRSMILLEFSARAYWAGDYDQAARRLELTPPTAQELDENEDKIPQMP